MTGMSVATRRKSAVRKLVRYGAAVALMAVGACARNENPSNAVVPEPEPAVTSYAIGPNQTSVGSATVYVTRQGDTLLDIARQYDLGYTQLITANRGIDPWKPGIERQIVIPGYYLVPNVPRRGIVINLAQQRLYYFPPGGNTVETFPIGVGVEGWVTPLGATKIVEKEDHPTWHPPPSIRAEDADLPSVVPPGPDNPLGDYAFRLTWPAYLIHGTNKPYGIGRNVSHGCVHLYPEDMAHLFQEIPVGTPVRVIDREVEAAWIGPDLYVAVFPNKEQTEALDTDAPVPPILPKELKQQVKEAAGSRAGFVDWAAVETAARERTGIPVRVTRLTEDVTNKSLPLADSRP